MQSVVPCRVLYLAVCCTMQCAVPCSVLYHAVSEYHADCCTMQCAVPYSVLQHAVCCTMQCAAGADASVVRRTQAKLGAQHKPTVHYSAYFTVPTYFTFLLFAFFGKLLETLARFSWGRRALLTYPRLFSYGLFSREGPNEQQLAQTRFQMKFAGHGYSQGGLMSLFLDSATFLTCVTCVIYAAYVPVLPLLPV